MPRHARIQYPGGIYHIISRFVNRRYCLDEPGGRKKYLRLLEAGFAKTDAVLLGYCLMSSHVHLVIRAGKEPLEGLMKSIHVGFARWYNSLNKRREGPVFAGRYKSILVCEEEYLLELMRYVHNNPVRAGKVEEARKSDWSSHQAYVGDSDAPEWLNVGYVLKMLNDQRGWACRQFDRFVREGVKEKRRGDLNGEMSREATQKFRLAVGDGWQLSGPIVGSAQFATKVLADIERVDTQLAKGRSVRVPRNHSRPRLKELVAVTSAELGLEPWEFEARPRQKMCAFARRVIVYMWVKLYGGQQTDVARELHADTGAVSKWYSKAIKEAGDIEPWCDRIKDKFPTILAHEDSVGKVRYSFEIEE